MHEKKLTNLWVLEWFHEIAADPKQTILTIHLVDQTSIKYISRDNTESNWIRPDGPLCATESNLDLLDTGQLTRISMDVLVRERWYYSPTPKIL